MMKFTARLSIFFSVLFCASAVQADCGTFSEMTFWSGMNHESVKRNVQVRYRGDWQNQIQALEDRQEQLKKIYARNSGVELTYKNKKIVIFDEELAAYIEQAEARLEVVRCLADQEMDLPEMSTASGPAESAPLPSK